MSQQDVGPIIVIGGHEDKENERAILHEVADRLGHGKLVIATVASHQPDGYFDAYKDAFAALGRDDLVELYIDDRKEAGSEETRAILADAAGIFFSGGDQLRLSSQIGDTPIEEAVWAIHRRGGVIAGTSAGASVLGEVMLVRGPSRESHRIGDLNMAPGLRLIENVIIDQHFAERGRIGRLLGAVAHNPRVLGIGIDEDTAIVVERGRFKVIGSGAIYVIDGQQVSHSNVAEARRSEALSICDVCLHTLASDCGFDFATRRPASADQM